MKNCHTQLIVIFATLMLTHCSSIPKPSPESLQVVLLNSGDPISSGCLYRHRITAYGSSPEEAKFDLRHKAIMEEKAHYVMLETLTPFNQTIRLNNYHRTPKLKFSLLRNKYYYKKPFKYKAEGKAVHCLLDK